MTEESEYMPLNMNAAEPLQDRLKHDPPEERKQFTFYKSFLDAMLMLPEDMWLGYLANVASYGIRGQLLMDMNNYQEGMFLLVKPTLDAARIKALSGTQGGARKKSAKLVSKKENKKKTETETETEIETESENQGQCQGPVAAGFEVFWDQYPLKLGKEQARKAWLHRAPETQAMCQALELWCNSAQWKKEKGRFIPKAAKFITECHDAQIPVPYSPRGVLGELGQAEIEAINTIMKEEL